MNVYINLDIGGSSRNLDQTTRFDLYTSDPIAQRRAIEARLKELVDNYFGRDEDEEQD